MRLVGHVAITIRILGLVVALNPLPAIAFFDQDGDGITDANDNCTLTGNSQQIDSNADGIGNACDADLNDDGLVDDNDLQLLFQFYQDNNLDADLNEDGRIDNWDWNILKSRMGRAPGPAGVGAYFYDRPRILASGAKFSQLESRLTWQHYERFWGYTRNYARRIASEAPPCPQNNPGCGAPENISEYTESSIRGFGDILPPLAMAYRLSGEQVYLDGARKWMNALVSYENWASNSDIGAAHILIGMSVTYDWLYDSFTEAERQSYRDKMAYHANIFYNLLIAENSIWWKYNYYSNHNYTNALGLALTAMALYGEVDEADDWIDAARDNFDTVLSLVSPDGACLEGPSYWALQMSHLLPYFSAISRFAPQVGAQILDNGFFQNAASYRLYASLPNYLQVADYADNPRHDFYLSAHVLRGLAAIFNDSHAQWLAERIESAKLDRGDPIPSHWLNLLWYHPELPPTPPNDLPPYKHFDNMGVLFARSSWDEDAFWSFHKSGPFQGYHAEALGFYRGSHAHPDTGQFLAWSQGRWLINEDGYVNLKRTENHNLLTFNGSGQLGADNQWFNSGEVLFNAGTVVPLHSTFTDDALYMVTDIAPMYRAAADVASWQRSFIALPEGYQVIRDDVMLSNPGQIENSIHADLIARVDGASAILNPRERMTEAFDRNGKGNDGVVTGGYAVAGRSGKALHFLGDYALQLTGEMDKVVFPTLSGSAFPESGTLSLWLKSDSFAGQGIVNIVDAADPSRDHIYIRTSRGNPSVPISGIEVGFQSANGAGWALGVGLPHEVWHHLVITWDTANDEGQVYINNSLVYSAAIADAGWTPSAQIAKIGGGFIGGVDEMNLYSRVLDTFEIASLYNLAKVTADLEGSWTFDGIDNTVMSEFREYSYRLVYPAGSTLNSAYYLLPPEERAGPQGNYWGQLFSNSYSSSGNETIIHFVGDVSTPVNYDAATNKLSISHDTYSIDIDFNARSVIRSPNQ